MREKRDFMSLFFIFTMASNSYRNPIVKQYYKNFDKERKQKYGLFRRSSQHT